MRLASRLGLDLVYLLLGLPAGIATFTFVVTGWSLALGLAITLIGLPVALVTIWGSRGLAEAERLRARLVLPARPRGGYRRWSGGPFARLRIALADPQTWRDLLWHLVLLPVGIAGFTIAVVAVAAPLEGISLPIWWDSVGRDHHQWYTGFVVNSTGRAWLAFAIGIALLPVGAALLRGAAAAQAALARSLLGAREGAELRERVERLTETRAGAVDAAAAELERIERDLHDGAQARLVALAMDLGMAEEKLDADPEAARELVGRARAEAKRANAELRDLARGIHPPLLADRGLAEAVRALAARSPIPAAVSIDLPARPPRAVEAAAYFVVSEALTNAAKHSRAPSVSVRLTGLGGRLEVEVRDDGAGGADAGGGGLHGLRRRVEALDGRLELSSPPGGPTILRAELPCAS